MAEFPLPDLRAKRSGTCYVMSCPVTGWVFMFAFAQKSQKGLMLRLHVQPGASRNEIAGIHGDALKLRVTARAESGAANQALCAFLAGVFGLPKTSISILHGQSSRKKTVLVEGNGEDLLRALEKHVPSGF